MVKIIRLTLPLITTVLLLAGLFGGLAAVPSAAKTALSPPPSGLGKLHRSPRRCTISLPWA